MFCIVWWEYSDYKDGQYDEDGMNGYAVDHYEYFNTMEEAKKVLPHYLNLDHEAYILEV